MMAYWRVARFVFRGMFWWVILTILLVLALDLTP